MESLASRVGSGKISPPAPTSPPSSKLETYGFAIAIIVGIGGLAAGAAGLSGYFQVGALSNIAQVDAITLMAAGGGSGTILLIIGVFGTVKNRQAMSHQRHGDVHVDSERSGATRKSGLTKRAEMIKSIDTQDGSVYGPEAWKIWEAEVLDAVPPAPQVDLSKKDKVLLYIPRKIRFQGRDMDFNLKALKRIGAGPFSFISELVEKQFGDQASPGWVLIDKTVLPESRNKNYETQKKMVEERGCSMPSVLEAVVLNLMFFQFNRKWLCAPEDWMFTRCIERVDGNYPVVVGSFFTAGLWVRFDYHENESGVACARRNF